MEISLKAHGSSLDSATAETIRRRLESAIDRVRPYVRRVSAHLEDENGEKGGVDKRCVVVVDVQGRGRVVVRERRQSFLAAATKAAHRIALVVRSRLRRRNGLRQQRPVEAAYEVMLPG